MPYSSSKFDCARTEVLYDLMDWWAGEASGNSEAPTGWYTQPITITEADFAPDPHYVMPCDDDEPSSDLLDAIANVTGEYLLTDEEVAELQADLIGVFIMGGDDRGFVWSTHYSFTKDAEAWFEEQEITYAEWENGHAADCVGCEHDCPWRPGRGLRPLGAPFCSTCDDHAEAVHAGYGDTPCDCGDNHDD